MKIKMTCPTFNLSTRGSEKTFFQVHKVQNSLWDILINIFSKSLETFHTYYGQDLEGKTLKTRRHIDTLYFLSNKVELDPKSNYGFNCTYLFIWKDDVSNLIDPY